MKIKVTAVFDIDENVFGTEESEMEWFREMIADKENTMFLLLYLLCRYYVGLALYFLYQQSFP